MVPTVSHFSAAVALRLWVGHARCRRPGLLVTFRLPRLGLGFLGSRTTGPGNRAGDRNGLNGHMVGSDQSSFGLLRVDFHGAEFAVLAVLVQDWDAVAPWLAGPLFSDTANRQAFDALVESDGDLEIALDRLDGPARDVVERAAIVDVVVDAPMEARVLIAAAVRRELRRVIPGEDSERIASDAQARRLVEDLQDPHRAEDAAEWLLGWLIEREEVADGAS